MKTIFLFLSLLLSAQTTQAVVIITGFGTGDFTATFTDFTPSQTATTYQIIGNDLNSLYGSISTPVNISGSMTSLSLLGTFTGTAANNFQMELFDADGDSRIYQGNWSGFTPSVPTSVSLGFLSETGTFNGTVVSIGFITAGSGLGSVNLVLDTLTAVPEPSTYALLVGGLAGIWALRRQRA